MRRRRVSAGGGRQAPPSQRGTADRVRRITRNGQAPRRYGQVVGLEAIQPEQEEIQEPESASDQVLPSEYSQSTQADIKFPPSTITNESDAYTQSATMEPTSRPASSQQSSTCSQAGFSLQDIRHVTESTIIATIHCPDVGYCLFGISLVTHIPYHVPCIFLIVIVSYWVVFPFARLFTPLCPCIQ